MRLLRSLRGQVTALVVGVASVATVLSLWAARYNAERGILEQLRTDGDLVGSVIAEAVALSREIPDQLEHGLERDMASTARLLAEYVALAERQKMPRRTMLKVLEGLTADLGVAEVWITDSQGRVVYSVPHDVPFVFSPDPAVQPQASAFWPLITGQAKQVSQPTQPRDLDGLPYKYVGVGGVDGPRIVQLGVRKDDVVALRERLSLKRVSDILVREGVLKRPLLVVNGQLETLDSSAASSAEPSGAKPIQVNPHHEVSARDADGLKQALSLGRAITRLEADAAMIYRPYQTADGRHQGAFAAGFSRDALDQLLARQQRLALVGGVVVLAVASLTGWLVSRRITARLSRITSAARGVRKGNFTRLDELQADLSQQDEVGVLGQAIHQMGLEVRNREAVLEGLVRERTQELSERNGALAAAQAVINGELELAKRLQLGILPPAFPARAGWGGSARILMQQQMGGDFYDFIERPDGTVALVMADVSGKGIAAAFFMAMARTSLLHHLSHGLRADESLIMTNDELCRANPLDLFVTVFVAVLDPVSGRMEYSNAGHNPPLHRRADGTVSELVCPGDLALGVMPEYVYALAEIQCNPGDHLLAYTDGVTEAFDGSGKEFGVSRLVSWLAGRPPQESPDRVVDALFHEVQLFQGSAPQSDDITVAVILREWPGIEAKTISTQTMQT